MLNETLIEIFERDLSKLKDEINSYRNETDLWATEKEISNSGGNLCLHLLGNLNHFIGATLGEIGYVRNRDAEFSDKNAPRETILRKIDETVEAVKTGLGGLTETDLQGNFPVEKHGETKKMEFMLLHLLTHFNYHLGQINYHRRLIQTEEK